MISIALKGYYGYGNLGDDLLFIVSYRFLKQTLPEANVLVMTEAHSPQYLQDLVQAKLEYVNQAATRKFDVLMLGGGGVFFDFSEGKPKDRLINFLIKLIGPDNYARAYQMLKPRYLRADRYLALGVGIGTYTANSKKLRSGIITLTRLNLLAVRDEESARNLALLLPNKPCAVNTDLAFAAHLWLPPYSRNPSSEVAIGFILRCWNDQIDSVTLDFLCYAAERYRIKLFLFDKAADNSLPANLPCTIPVHLWDPVTTALEDFLGELASCQIHFTQRAHGGIVSALLGVPFVALNIEPKLATIQQMFPHSSLLISDFSRESFQAGFFSAISAVDSMKRNLASDIEHNRALIEAALADAARFLKQAFAAAPSD